MADLLNIGLSGLSASKTSLSVTGHNISNVNTPGFSRQSTVQAPRCHSSVVPAISAPVPL